MKNERDLAVPEEVRKDAKSVEVLRAWVANEGLVCSLRPTIWEDPSAWGTVLADAAMHIANAFKDVHGVNPEVTLKKIRRSFERELTGPAEGLSGEFEE